jgi:hypothetical protein
VSGVFVHGVGAVSPAGWNADFLHAAVSKQTVSAPVQVSRPGWPHGIQVRRAPSPAPKPAFLAHARLRRSSPISHFAVSAALEALGPDAEAVSAGTVRLGIILCVMSGCVNYSRRFYDEVLKDPVTASPLVFPETVFNAPCSHLAALLGARGITYSIVGDPGTFLQGLALAGEWLVNKEVDGCLVIGAEEGDWITADAFRHFSRQLILSEGAGALYLKLGAPTGLPLELKGVTDSYSFFNHETRLAAAKKMRAELPSGSSDDLLSEGTQAIPVLDAPENRVWQNWPGKRLGVKRYLGEGLTAAAAWQCVAGIRMIQSQGCSSLLVSVAGCNQQVIGAHFST